VNVNAKGFVRLSFDMDGWASDANGLVPGPNYKTNLVDGFPSSHRRSVNAGGAGILIGGIFRAKLTPVACTGCQ
jgi:hypothetical protein